MKHSIVFIADETISKSEIDSFKDFEEILRGYHKQEHGWSRILKYKRSLNLVLLGSCIVMLLLLNGINNPGEQSEKVAADLPDDREILIGPFPSKQSSVTTPIPARIVQSSKIEGTNRIEGKHKLSPESKAEEIHLESMAAQPVHGFEDLYAYFNKELTYPEVHRADSIKGFVKVSFVIAADSSINSIKVVQSLGEPFDKEAVRLIEQMPPWRPATRNGLPHPTKFIMPIGFQIKQ